MKNILIIKTGSTFPELIIQKGDFEDMIIRGMGIFENEVKIVDVTSGDSLPNINEVSGVVITGSHAMVTDHHAWSEQTAIWLKRAVVYPLPILGICYGHQLLAYAFGGDVGNNPKGSEFGTVDVVLNESVYQDSLFEGITSPFKAHVSHMQTVLRLPDQARRLAVSSGDDCQSFVIGGCAWGVQFHPEFDRDTMIEYIRFCKGDLMAEEKNPDDLIANTKETPVAAEILKRFAAKVIPK